MLPFTRPLYIFFTSWCLHKHFISIFSITAVSAEQVAVYVFPLLPAGDTVSTLMSGSNLVVMIAPQILRCSKKNMGEKRACNKGQRMMFAKVTKKETAACLHNYIKYTPSFRDLVCFEHRFGLFFSRVSKSQCVYKKSLCNRMAKHLSQRQRNNTDMHLLFFSAPNAATWSSQQVLWHSHICT